MAVREHNPLQRRLYLPIVSTNGTPASTERKPPWLKVRLQRGPNYRELENIMRTRSLHTVCEEAMFDLDGPIMRIAGPDVPAMGFASNLEHAFMLNADQIGERMLELARF